MAQALKMDKLVKIGVFYDGNYFLHVSNYYNYVNQRRARLSIAGLHEFICQQVAQEEGVDLRHSKIVDAHYFRGRLSAQEASQKGNLLYYDRVFDDILMSEGVVTHYTPIRTIFGRREEKGIEVWLSLEAYELTHHKQFDVIVLIGSDGDYVPLARKINTLGTRVMLINWEFEFMNDEGNRVVTRTSADLAHEVTYAVPMHSLIEKRGKDADSLFVPQPAIRQNPDGTPAPRTQSPTITPNPESQTGTDAADGETAQGEIHSLKNGYGFIKFPPNNLFFHYTNVLDADFAELQEGDQVEFTLATNERGDAVAKNVRLLEQSTF